MIPGGAPARAVVLGTMRMHETGLGQADWADLLAAAWDRGVRRLHSSSEYESFPFFRAILERLEGRRPDVAFGHVVKLAEPSFDETEFSPHRFEDRLSAYVEALGTGRIDTVQWMWRAGLDDDPRRLADFRAAAERISAAKASLRRGGTLGELACFPYSRPFAAGAVESDLFDGLIVYANAYEREYQPEMEQAARKGLFVDIIRPFAQGRSVKESRVPAHQLLADLIASTGARSAILSISGPGQLDALLPPVATVAADG